MNRFAFCIALLLLSIGLSAQENSTVPENTFELERFTHGISFIPMLNFDRAQAFPYGFEYSPSVGFGLGYQFEKRIKAQFSWSLSPHFQWSKNKLTINSMQTPPNISPNLFEPYQTELGELNYQDISFNLPVLFHFYSESIPFHFTMGLSFNTHFAVKNEWTYDLIELTREHPDDFVVVEKDLQGGFESGIGEIKPVVGLGYNTPKWNFDFLFSVGGKKFINRLGYRQASLSLVATYKLGKLKQ